MLATILKIKTLWRNEIPNMAQFATDFVYGAQFGIINDIAHNLELEIGTKFTKYDIDKNYKENGADVKYKLDRVIDFYATINYRF